MVQSFTLANGVRVLVEPHGHVRSAAIGLWCRTGSRHEAPGEEGITHLIEHMLFKGTARRTAKEIAEAIEGRGGELNAFTSKEQTCYYCRVLADEVGAGLDVLADMMTGSLLDAEELEREKGVVLEEIRQSEDEPAELVHDLHLQARWRGHPLGKPVIGTKESVAGFAPEALRAYMARRYRAENVLVAVAGMVDADAFRDMAGEMLGGLPTGAAEPDPVAPVPNPGHEEHRRPVEQVHFCIGTDSCANTDPRAYAAAVLDAMLGGGMSSRLFQEVRERRGLAYSIGSYHHPYSLGGAFVVYGGTSEANWPQVRGLVAAEMAKLARGEFGRDELDRVKRQLSGHIVLALESMSARMMRMARNEIIFGREVQVEETLQKIDAVSERDVTALAEEWFAPERVSTTAIVPA
jgi:predicted Zn-dependent peptidase